MRLPPDEPTLTGTESAGRDRDIHEAMDPARGWQFNAAVTAAFDEMLQRSIPDYAGMREAVTAASRRFAVRGTRVLDLGSSRGEAIAPLLDHFGAALRYTCVEVSQPMRDAFAQRYGSWLQSGVVEVLDYDLRRRFPWQAAGAQPPQLASLVLSVLTLMFVPINYRQRIVQASYDVLVPGGAMVLVEKVLGEGATLDEWMARDYREFKRRSGYTDEEVDRKALALEGVQVPVTASWNVELLRRAGFAEVDCTWRSINFGCWVAVKR
jgi:tRNA (cmo5U34)-methyltransferase